MTFTIDTILNPISWGLIGVGSFFLIAGGIGILRLPHFHARLHAVSLIDTLGALAPLVALALQMETLQSGLKVSLILLFLLITLPATTHALAKAARRYDRKDLP